MKRIAAMAWFRPETFAKLRAMFEDGYKLHGTYEEWLVKAEGGRKELEARGVQVITVDIDPDKFPKWCHANGIKLDAEARTRYAIMVASAAGAEGKTQ